MATRRQARLLLTLSIVLGVHLIAVWLLVSAARSSVKTKFGSLQLLWISRPALSETPPARETATQRARKSSPHTPVDREPAERSSALSSNAPRSADEDRAAHPAPDWSEELRLAARDAMARELAQKRHESDFAHAFPTQPKPPQQFAWDYAATHRIEGIPGGGILVHLGDNCVLILFPLPLVGCGIGKRPANGDLFEHLHD
jgi:hypothetical protein